MNKKPRFNVGDDVVYHKGNWKWVVNAVYWDEKGDVFYYLFCNEDEDVCSTCRPDDEYVTHIIHQESDLIGIDEWRDHSEKGTCKVCCN